jgi:quinol monooxygenase YgiN
MDRCADFEAFVIPRMARIQAQPGCHEVELHLGPPGHYFTVSRWSSEKDLDAYRDSSLFAEIWPTVKPWFSAKAEAWTTTQIPF